MSSRHKSFAKLIRAFIAAAAAIYEMVYKEDAPKSKEVLR